MRDRIIWYSPAKENMHNGMVHEGSWSGEHSALRDHFLLGRDLEMKVSTDLEDLRIQLTPDETALLVAEIPNAADWEGWQEVYTVREKGRQLPVVIISEGGGPEVAIAVFEAGGNEYMDKPLHPEELRCRIRNLLSLTGRRRLGNEVLRVDGLILEPTRRYVSRDGEEKKLTPKEFELLYYLVSNVGEVCLREEILSQVWGYRFAADTNVVDVYIRHLRLKVDKGYRNKLIHTVRGAGYVLRAPEEAPLE
ncbi:winged helix-turn-helix domain-containing protein [Paenibacillus sp. sgz500958]|uniref:winged helix-turn-helix domain-containing protein n=1 Tax=Paenibacillus sp. sgz500958 TaxID=3242475 RepID=UPI0036D39BC7